MGFHICEYCGGNINTNNTSSGDVAMVFVNGRSWRMPDMIIHYVRDHHWQPPAAFIDNVMNHQLTGGSRAQSKGIGETYSTHRDAIPIGYLTGQFETGNVPDGFIDKLVKLMKQADEMSLRLQTRGI